MVVLLSVHPRLRLASRAGPPAFQGGIRPSMPGSCLALPGPAGPGCTVPALVLGWMPVPGWPCKPQRLRRADHQPFIL